MTPKKIISFGYKHGYPPKGPGIVVVDIRKLFLNPYSNPRLRTKTGQDRDVQSYVMTTPDFVSKLQYVKDQITVPGTDVAYIGCMGGRHRSVVIAQLLGEALKIPVEHRDMERA